MANGSLGYGVVLIGIVLGLATLVYGVFHHVTESIILVGGFIVLGCVAWLSLQAAALDH